MALSTSKRAILLSCLIAAVCITAVCAKYCRFEDAFLRRLHTLMQSVGPGEHKSFAVSSLTDFDWDGFYVFGPYTTPDQINTALGYEWPVAKSSGLYENETFCLLVFTSNGRVIKYYEYGRLDGDWTEARGLEKMSPVSAVFTVVRQNSGRLQIIQSADVSRQ